MSYLGIAAESASQNHPSEDYMLVFIRWQDKVMMSLALVNLEKEVRLVEGSDVLGSTTCH